MDKKARSTATVKTSGVISINNKPQPAGWVLYDAACGFCSWWIPYWRDTIRKTGYDIAPLQETWVLDKLNEAGLQLSDLDVANDIRLLLQNGKVINGADAYLFGMQRVWWSRPFGYFFALPGLRRLTWKFYRVFNRNRFFVSKVCGLPPALEDKKI